MGIGMSKLVNRVMPRGLRHWQKRLGAGPRAEIQVLSLTQKGLGLLPGTEGLRSQAEERIQFLQEDPYILRTQLANLQQRVDSSPTGQHSLDVSGRILTVNHMWTQVLGYSEAEVCGKRIFDFIVPEQMANAEKRFFARLNGLPLPDKDADREYLAKDGTRIKAITFNTVIPDENGVGAGVITSFIDITRLREVEEELKKARGAIIQQEKLAAVAELATTMSHSIKNLLAGSIGDVEALRNFCIVTRAKLLVAEATERLQGETSQADNQVVKSFLLEVRKLACSLEKSLAAMDENTEGLLDYARKRTEPKHPVSVVRIVEGVIDSLTNFTEKRNVTLELDNRSLEQEDGVCLHEEELAKIIRNLVKNAVESYTNGKANLANKTVKIVISKTDDFETGRNRITIGVFDEGIGMTQERIKELHRAATGGIISFKPGGSGFGFLTVKRIVERIGGKINIISAEDKYTRMMVILPLAEEKAETEAEQGLDVSSIRYLRKRLKEITVMLIDDQSHIKETFEQVLKSMGFNVVSFENPKDALRAYAKMQDRPQVVITDWKMDHLMGDELIESIRKVEEESKPQFIIISGNANDPEIRVFSEKQTIPCFVKGNQFEGFQALVLQAAEKVLGEGSLVVKEEDVLRADPCLSFGREAARLISESFAFADWFDMGNYLVFSEQIQEGYEDFLELLNAFEQIIANPQDSLPIILEKNDVLNQIFSLVPAEERHKLAIVLDICLNQGLNNLRNYLADGWQELPKQEIQQRVDKVLRAMRAMQLKSRSDKDVFFVELFQGVYDLLSQETNPSQAPRQSSGQAE